MENQSIFRGRGGEGGGVGEVGVRRKLLGVSYSLAVATKMQSQIVWVRT